jgi:hypothetical protein
MLALACAIVQANVLKIVLVVPFSRAVPTSPPPLHHEALALHRP